MIVPGSRTRAGGRAAILFSAFFAASIGLGYGSLARFRAPEVPGLHDAGRYALMVREGIGRGDEPWRFRVLVPALARPIFLSLDGRTGSWAPEAAALLIVNAALSAGTALAIVVLSAAAAGSWDAGLAAGLLYLLTFAVPNFHLAGLVDSGEALAFALLALALASGRFGLSPVVLATGVLAKETFLPLGVLFGLAWAVAGPGPRVRKILWTAMAALAGGAALTAVRSLFLGRLSYPLEGAPSVPGGSELLAALGACFGAPAFWYTFAGLVPFALPRLSRLPAPWRAAAATAALGAAVLGAWAGSGGNAARGMFDASAAPLCAAAGWFLSDRAGGKPASG